MNDVMIRYKSKVYKSILTNRVYKIVDEFTPFHRGGYLINGFGYQLHNIANSDISDVSIEGLLMPPNLNICLGKQRPANLILQFYYLIT